MKKIKRENLQELIEPFLHTYLKFEDYEIFEFDAKDLISPNRLDLIYKVVFLRGINLKDNFMKNCYLDHIKSFNFGDYLEFGNPNKNSQSKFLSIFKDIDRDISNNGFDINKSVIPLSKDGSILNGSHRVASSIVRNKKVSCIKLLCDPLNYNYEFFRNRLVNQIFLEEIILNYLKESHKCSIALIWPRANLNVNNLKKMFKKIVYLKEVKLTLNGLDKLVKFVYQDEDWVIKDDNYNGSFLKTSQCFKFNETLKLIVFESEGKNYDLNLKSRIRDVCKVGNHSIHTSDNKLEAIKIARILLNKNSKDLINGYFGKDNMLKYLIHLEDLFKKNELSKENFIISYKFSLYLYGIEKRFSSNYYEIYSLKYKNQLKDLKVVNMKSDISIYNNILYNPEYFLWINNIKFISIQGILYLQNIGFIKIDNKTILKLRKIKISSNLSIIERSRLFLYYLYNICKYKFVKFRNSTKYLFKK